MSSKYTNYIWIVCYMEYCPNDLKSERVAVAVAVVMDMLRHRGDLCGGKKMHAEGQNHWYHTSRILMHTTGLFIMLCMVLHCAIVELGTQSGRSTWLSILCKCRGRSVAVHDAADRCPRRTVAHPA